MARKIRYIADIVDWGLCVGCGACYAYCPYGAVHLADIESVGIRPQFDPLICTKCSECLAICPGYQIDTYILIGRPSAPLQENRDIGSFLEIWEGHSTDKRLRTAASSGGMLSALASYCIERGGMRAVVHSGMNPERPWANQTVISRSREDMLQRVGSRYAPASPCEGLRNMPDRDVPAVFIGKPCDAAAAAKLCMQHPELNKQIGLIMAFFCAGTPSTQGTLDLLASLRIAPDQVERLHYRGEGWPGEFKVLRRGYASPKAIPYMQAWSHLTKYVPYRCQLCPDGLGHVADITCGDAWESFVPGTDDNGRSIVIVRTQRGRKVLQRAQRDNYITLIPLTPEKLLEAQKNLIVRRRELLGRLLAMRCFAIPVPQYQGFSLVYCWLKIPVSRKLRSIFGTFYRILGRSLWRKNHQRDRKGQRIYTNSTMKPNHTSNRRFTQGTDSS